MAEEVQSVVMARTDRACSHSLSSHQQVVKAQGSTQVQMALLTLQMLTVGSLQLLIQALSACKKTKS